MNDGNQTNRGFVFAELIVALGLLGLIIAVLSSQLIIFGRFNDYQLARQRCNWAAQAQIESIAATGEPIEKSQFNKLWPDIDIEIEETNGEGQWKNLKLVKATARSDSYGKKVKVELARYIPQGKVE